MGAARGEDDSSGGRPRRASRACRPVVVLAAVLLALVTAGPARAAETDSVFHIDRNKNRNQVHYGVHVDDRCRPVGTEPVYNYWLRLEKSPPETEPLRFFQQAAYGFQKQEVETDGRIEVRLRALPGRQVVIRLAAVGGACKAEAFLTIDGKDAHLEKVFVFADEGLLLPTVRYIELYGRSNDGVSVYEKIAVDD
jgi:hypothetical protein